MNAQPLLTTLLAALHKERLQVVLIGNAAAALHGAPVTTLDFDFMFRDTALNLAKLKRVAGSLRATIMRPFYPVSKLYRLYDDATGLRVTFVPTALRGKAFTNLQFDTGAASKSHVIEPNLLAGDARVLTKPPRQLEQSKSRRATLAVLAAESDRQLDELIRRRLAMTFEQRMNFLRRRLPGGGSCL